MLLAGVFFALMNVSVKFIPHIPAIEIILFRSIFSLIFSYVFLKNQKIPVFGNNKKLLVIRGIVGSVGLIGFFYTLQKIPLASTVTIQYLSPIFSGLAYNVIRKLKNTEHPLVIIFYFPLVTLPVASLISYFTWVQPIGWDWLILLWIGICTQAAQYFMTVAYQNANVSKISSLSYLGILYALFFGFVLFGETFGIMSYVGMGLVLIGILLNLREK